MEEAFGVETRQDSRKLFLFVASDQSILDFGLILDLAAFSVNPTARWETNSPANSLSSRLSAKLPSLSILQQRN